jgi:hypothetical protein
MMYDLGFAWLQVTNHRTMCGGATSCGEENLRYTCGVKTNYESLWEPNLGREASNDLN